MVVFNDVTKRYENNTLALKDINLTIEDGEFVFIVGESGSGKTTMFKLIVKEESPTYGNINVNGNSLNTMDKREIPFFRRDIGMVFQDFRLLPQKSVYDNVAFAMQITEALPKEIRRRVPMALALTGLSRKADAYPEQLSGGEQQRVSLARAIVNNPALLLADEPTGNLDPQTSWEIVKLLESINNRGTTVIMATHENTIVNLMKRRVVAINNGKIIRDQREGLYRDEFENG